MSERKSLPEVVQGFVQGSGNAGATKMCSIFCERRHESRSSLKFCGLWGPPECCEWLQVAGRSFVQHPDYDLDDRGALIDDSAF